MGARTRRSHVRPGMHVMRTADAAVAAGSPAPHSAPSRRSHDPEPAALSASRGEYTTHDRSIVRANARENALPWARACEPGMRSLWWCRGTARGACEP